MYGWPAKAKHCTVHALQKRAAASEATVGDVTFHMCDPDESQHYCGRQNLLSCILLHKCRNQNKDGPSQHNSDLVVEESRLILRIDHTELRLHISVHSREETWPAKACGQGNHLIACDRMELVPVRVSDDCGDCHRCNP